MMWKVQYFNRQQKHWEDSRRQGEVLTYHSHKYAQSVADDNETTSLMDFQYRVVEAADRRAGKDRRKS